MKIDEAHSLYNWGEMHSIFIFGVQFEVEIFRFCYKKY